MLIAYSEEVHKRWKQELTQYGIIYLYAMSGFGKTVQAVEFARREYKEWTRIEVTDTFTEDLEDYLQKKKTVRTKTLLIIDDLHWLKKPEARQQFLNRLLYVLKNQKTLHCMLLSRANLPEYLTVLKLTRQLIVETSDALALDEDMTMQLLKDSGICEKRQDLFNERNLSMNEAFGQCVQVTQGYPIAFNAYIERLKAHGVSYAVAYEQALGDVYSYLDIHIYQVWDLRHREAMLHLSVCDFFDMDLAEVILGEEAEEIVHDMYEIGSFIREESENMMRMHPLFLAFLRTKLALIPDAERSRLYERAGFYYEKHRYIVPALECYKRAGIFERMLQLMCYLSENADGCVFAKSCYQYMEELPLEYEERFPKLLGVKAMIYSYHMELEKSNYYLDKLKKKADEEKQGKVGHEALAIYIRTLIALPHGSAEKTVENLRYFPEFVKEQGIKVRNVIATGNMPSMINGGLDLLAWSKNYKLLYPVMKLASESVIGKEAVGIADVSVGEHLYELNQLAKSIASLTKGLSEANLKGSIRVQYAATGVMTRVFQADNQWNTAYEIMQNILERAKQTSFLELIPNIQASIMEMELRKGGGEAARRWLATKPAEEHEEFFVTERYRLLVKAKVYLSQGRNLEALYILELLEKYAILFERTYFLIELQILRAIAYERMGENWKPDLLQAVRTCQSFRYVRVLADQGAALLPLWKKLIEEEEVRAEFEDKYLSVVSREMKNMAVHYPKYLETPKTYGQVTKKEIEVLRLMADGRNNQQIAKSLNLSIATVKFHIGNILKKLQADNRTSAVFTAKQDGII